ncbi:MAG: hypothetical protein L3K11_06990 [Thermoplasmata archaeon]|nr:hypothetical protein [Thermoplasmata archaeon]
MVAYGGNGTLSYSYPTLPTGCTRANSSTLACTVAANGSFTAETQVRDSSGNLAFANLTLVVLPGEHPPLLVSNGNFSDLPVSSQLCRQQNSPPFYSSTCYPQTQQPTVLPSADGSVAVSYSAFTNRTLNVCPGAAANTSVRVEWARSVNGGSSFLPALDMGNLTCAYLDALEPSFVVDGSRVFGVFVEANLPVGVLPSSYDNRSSDALGFILGADNGTLWSAPRTILTGAGLARPSIAAHGNSVYVAYDRLNNSTTPIPGGVLPIAVGFLASTDGGVHWGTARTLPGLNASQGYDAMSPSVAVAPNGTVSVAYATNRSCSNSTTSSGACGSYWDDIVSVDSPTNGTTWTPPETVVSQVGESSCYSSGCLAGFYQSTPQIANAFDPVGDQLVAVAGGVFTFSFNPALWYRWTGLELAEQPTGVGSFSASWVAAPSPTAPANFFNPGLASTAQKVYLSYSEDNESLLSGPLSGSFSTWLAEGAIGSSPRLGAPELVGLERMSAGRSTNVTAPSFVGYATSVALNSSGAPLVAYSVARAPLTVIQHGPGYYYTNVSYPTNLTLAFAESPANAGLWTNLTVEVAGLPANTSWSVAIDGLNFTSTAPGLFFSGVPRGVPVLLSTGAVTLGAWTNTTEGSGLPPVTVLSGPTVDRLQFDVLFGFATYSASLPTVRSGGYVYEEISLNVFGPLPGLGHFSGYVDWSYDCNPPYYCNTNVYGTTTIYNATSYQNFYYSTFPVYIPSGMSFSLFIYGNNVPSAGFVNGTGTGAYNGKTVCNGYCTSSYGQWRTAGKIEMDSPGNESVWFGGEVLNRSFNVSVQPNGLPPGTPYQFTWQGTSHGTIAPGSVELRDQNEGAYTVGGISAVAPRAGWSYFGSAMGGDTVVVPFELVVTLEFDALVNLSSPPGPTSFHAVNLTAGTSWRLLLNGTDWSSTSPWLNLSMRPGTYAIGSSPVVGPQGDAGYLPHGVGPNVTLASSGSTVNLSFVPSFLLSATATTGGDLSENGGSPVSQLAQWLVPGTPEHLLASAFPGYLFLGWNGTGPGSYSGVLPGPTVAPRGPVRELASYAPLPGARFSLNFTEFGLPAGTWWSIALDGLGYSGNGSSVSATHLFGYSSGRAGSYQLSVPPAYPNGTALVRFLPGVTPSVVGTNGSSTPPVILRYESEGAVAASSTPGGSASVSDGFSSSELIWVPNGSSVAVKERAALGYQFLGWNGSGPGSYTGTNTTPTITSQGGPVEELASFGAIPRTSPPTYSVRIALPAVVPTGLNWTVALDGRAYLSSTDSITISGLAPGPHALVVYPILDPAGTTRYLSSPLNPASVTISSANLSVLLGYTVQYWVIVLATAGGTPGGSSGWYGAGSTLTLTATPDGSHLFSHWSGQGSGSYSGTDSTKTLPVTAPVVEVASFLPLSTPATTPLGFWQNSSLLLGGVALEVVAAAVVALLQLRRSRRERPELEAPEDPARPYEELSPEAAPEPPTGGEDGA